VRPRQTSRSRFRNQTRPENRFRPDRRLPTALECSPDFEASGRLLRYRQPHSHLNALGPYGAKDSKIGYSTFNARAESLTKRPAFRGAWQAGRRCLVLADGYYEWRDADKLPLAVALANRGPMTLAGLWDEWRSPEDESIKSFAIITTNANALLAPLHDRMPVVVPPDGWDDWLGENPMTERAVKTLLRPYPEKAMAFWAVDRRVGNVRNDSPDLFAPLNGAQK
jgi:putative SOS response-associated peptidase YedK